jgi:energy-coupling factor transport system permease protein
VPLHPGAWLVWAACAGLVAMSTTNPFYLLPLLAVAWLVYATRGAPGSGTRSFRVFCTFGAVAFATRTVLVTLGPVTGGSVVTAALEGMRLAVMLAVFGVFNAVVTPQGLLKLAPRRMHEPALAATLALTIAPRYVEAAARVREAQRLRGIRVGRLRALPSIAVPVLERGMEEALTLAESMDARGHGRGPRSRYRPQRWDGRASTAVLASVSCAIVFVGFDRAGSDLALQAFPLAWPQASWSHVAAVVGLAVPALLRDRR